MQTRKLGKTECTVSAIGFGCGAISGEGRGYGFGPINDRDSERLLHAALDSGISLYDLAPVYGFGMAEERIGRAFGHSVSLSSGRLRDKVFLISKSGITWDSRKRIHQDNRPETAVAMLNATLRRLRTEHIDLYMIHWPEGAYGVKKTGSGPLDLADTLRALNSERKAGKIRFLGLSNFLPEQVKPLLDVAPVSVLQNEWNYWRLHKDPVEIGQLRNFCRENDLGLLGWGTLDKGVLSGRVTPERVFDPLDARSWAPWWVREDQSWKYKALNELAPELSKQGLNLLEFAIGQALQFPELSSALVGMRSLDQLKTVTAALAKLANPQST